MLLCVGNWMISSIVRLTTNCFGHSLPSYHASYYAQSQVHFTNSYPVELVIWSSVIYEQSARLNSRNMEGILVWSARARYDENDSGSRSHLCRRPRAAVVDGGRDERRELARAALPPANEPSRRGSKCPGKATAPRGTSANRPRGGLLMEHDVEQNADQQISSHRRPLCITDCVISSYRTCRVSSTCRAARDGGDPDQLALCSGG